MADKTHVTRQGETWDTISLDYYGTEKYASLLTRCNPEHVGTLFFSGGVSLRIPERVDAQQAAIPAPPWKRGASGS